MFVYSQPNFETLRKEKQNGLLKPEVDHFFVGVLLKSDAFKMIAA